MLNAYNNFWHKRMAKSVLPLSLLLLLMFHDKTRFFLHLLFIYVFIQQIFKCLFCAKGCSSKGNQEF